MIAALAAASLVAQLQTFDVRDFGAVGDGKTNCAEALQRAIDRASQSGRGVVDFPAGKFLTGTLILKSNVEIRLDRGATILGSRLRSDYSHGAMYALLRADGCHDIAITGEGEIDGQGALVAEDVLQMVKAGLIKIPPHGWRPSETERTELIEFNHCDRVILDGVTLKNASAWVQTYRKCTSLTLSNLKVDSKTYWNNDGFDIVDCRKVKLSGCDVDADDDGICLKSEDPLSSCDDVSISDCRIRSSASAIKFGTASFGGFRNVHISDISVRDTFRSVLAIESVDGGTIENVTAERIKAVHTGNPFFIRVGHRNLKAKPGSIKHILIKDFECDVPLGRPDPGYPFKGPYSSEPQNICPSSVVGHVDSPVEDVRLENITLRMPGGGDPKIAYRAPMDVVPERAENYPEFSMFGELPAWAFYMKHVRGLQVSNFAVSSKRGDYRPAFVFSDVEGMRGVKIKVNGKTATFPKSTSSHRGARMNGAALSTDNPF